MFDIGFLELVVIGVIALIVLGPERLPKAARTVGHWVGRAKQSFNAIKLEIDRELKVQELQQQLEEQKNKLDAQLQLEELAEKVIEPISESQHAIEALNKTLNDQTDSAIEPKK